MTTGYIYHNKQVVSAKNINNIIDKVKEISDSQENYYFLRYPHQVSGICLELPTERGEIAGQMFNATCELRWKKYKTEYEVLILSKQEIKLEGFEALNGEWKICDRNAYWHDINETQFPKGFIFPDKKPKIQQRYFQDSDTATVHFVALTIKNKSQNQNQQ